MRKPLLLLPLFFLFLLTFVSASSQVFNTCGTSDEHHLCITPSNDDNFVFNLTQEFKIHTFTHEGAIVNDASLTCSARFVDDAGNGYGVSKTGTSSTYSKFTLSSGLLDEGYVMSYTIWCSAGDDNGYLTGEINLLTGDEEVEQQGQNILLVMILVPLIIALLLVIGAGFLGETHAILRLLSYLLVIPFSWVSFHFGMLGLVKYSWLTELQIAVGDTTYWMGWLFFTIIFYFIIYFIYVAFNVSAQKKKEKLEY